MFLEFFRERKHTVVRSSSLVPTNDPTLLFTNAGMNQFKDVFLGLEQRDYRRATTCQKCVRAGGKHNDLENVGFTNRHHTFFEMLGNFSFGDYFKPDAIAFAWELVTSPKWYGIPLEKLYFTVFGGAEMSGTKLAPDHDAAGLWTKIGAPKDRVLEIPGLKENFWQMGETGPCGPCSEIHYDMGPAASDQGHTDCKFPCDCGRYVEIWNLVFMQFNRDAKGKLSPLPKPSIDTGAGLERITAVLQGQISNFETDLFRPLMSWAANLCGHQLIEADIQPSLRIIADHSRAATFLISDGVIPSNEGRGYVLRKIIRRALRHARMMSPPSAFLSTMATRVREQMKEAYPELEESAQRVTRVLDEEENRFSRTVGAGLEKLDDALNALATNWMRGLRFTTDVETLPAVRDVMRFRGDYDAISSGTNELLKRNGFPFASAKESVQTLSLAGNEAFKAYDTYGLPRDFIEDVTRDAGISVDWAGFDLAMEEQRTRAKASWKGGTQKEAAKPVYTKLRDTFRTEPDFYFGTRTKDARIEAIVTKEGSVNEIPAGAEAEVVLDRTTIYAESGGQVADIGALYDNTESQQVAEVRGAYYPVSGLIAHRIVAKEDLRVGDRVATVADPERRARDMRNHTATHLLNAALRNILGTHVKQSGSLVAPDHLRFDFTHFAAVGPDEIAEIETHVNEEIRRNLEVCTDLMPLDEALGSGALAFFGDKYPDANVRVVTIPDTAAPRGFYSKELCGGTHVARIGEIGLFKVIGEQSTSAGVRRIEAISGDEALAQYQKALATLRGAAGLLGSGEDEILSAIQRQNEQIKALERQLEASKRANSATKSAGLLDQVREIKGVKVLAANLNDSVSDRDSLRQMIDTLRQKLGSGVVVLFATNDGKVSVIAGVTKDLTAKLHAGKIVQELAKQLGGSGGGRPDLAEAGGKDTSAIESTLQSIYPLVERSL
ncbi:MAG TPA: alanine--tRNA ligase [Candidatus Acidoferrales bacterium]|nr:alanine--tRNA ligase [Candidatus Acidoferrales bacterium]